MFDKLASLQVFLQKTLLQQFLKDVTLLHGEWQQKPHPQALSASSHQALA